MSEPMQTRGAKRRAVQPSKPDEDDLATAKAEQKKPRRAAPKASPVRRGVQSASGHPHEGTATSKSVSQPEPENEPDHVEDVASQPHSEQDIKEEIKAKSHLFNGSRRMFDLFTTPNIYVIVKDYCETGKGTLDQILKQVNEDASVPLVKNVLKGLIQKNLDFYCSEAWQVESATERLRKEMENFPSSLNFVKPDKSGDKVVLDKHVEQRIMDLLDNSCDPQDASFEAPLVPPGREEDMVMLEAEGHEQTSSIVMTNDELRMVQNLGEDAKTVLDRFNFREIQRYDEFCEAFRPYVTEECSETHLLQFLEYRRLENPPPLPENPKDMSEQEVLDFVATIEQETAYFLDLYNHREIYGINTVGLILESRLGFPLTLDTVQRILNERRKANPPIVRDQGGVTVTAGYLSHDYWPSLLCVPDGEHSCRYFNLTNTRNDGYHRYYRCSKCCTIKNIIDQQNKRSSQQIEFVVPKIQIHGDHLVTDVHSLDHHQDCKSIPIPVMLAEQLDRRARRQVSLGLMAPREAWTEGYFEALRISDTVAAYHPTYRTVAEIFPSYDICRGQYSRNFHKLKRRLSMPQDYEPVVDKRKLVGSQQDLVDGDFGPGTSTKAARPKQLRTRRGHEADERFNELVPAGIKNEMAPGYITVESSDVYYYDEHVGDYYGPVVEGVPLEQVEQEEVVVTDENQGEHQAHPQERNLVSDSHDTDSAENLIVS